MYEAN